ncbi:15-cis-phytoene synthase [Pseudogemmobacter blasticus]|uniref:Phytoene synthase n=1 Tax=Fuscovulum blasticum DSM 2131 TaxID=1188250 RepID=A0A2T4J4X6_FUSBL|nr:phytoene/squalene synthase family protein [Fuscovulum blasticum]PTE12956.1 phytoene synthase [Fuscovulum blasticum DSM 2131]
MIAEADLLACRAAIRTGSLSFHSASRLLPRRVCDPALALYAFCRLSDDAVDEGADKTEAVLHLRDRLDRIYAGHPFDAAPDRAFAAVVEEFEMPRELPDALLEGMAWDATGRRYDTLSGVLDYSARVAAVVGVMMCVLMRVREADALARACDLGLAMQLSNIARDVGEDARAGRVYLPLDWLAEEGITPDALFALREPTPGLRRVVRRLLAQARRLYWRSESGIGALPVACRPGIWAARLIYDGIGGAVARNGFDSLTRRAHTSKLQKLAWLGEAGLRAALTSVMPQPAIIHAAPEPEVAFLVNAAARGGVVRGRSDALLSVLAQLEARDRNRRASA